MSTSLQRIVLWDDNTNKQLVSAGTGSASVAAGQVAVGTSATLAVPARAGRRSVTFSPTTNVAYFVGGPGVTTATGFAVAAGGATTIQTAGEVYAVGAAGFTLSFIENYS